MRESARQCLFFGDPLQCRIPVSAASNASKRWIERGATRGALRWNVARRECCVGGVGGVVATDVAASIVELRKVMCFEVMGSLPRAVLCIFKSFDILVCIAARVELEHVYSREHD